MSNKKRIYFDYAAATPVDGRVALAMQKVSSETWANPSSLHEEGERAKNILEQGRKEIAYTLHCRASEVIFTAGATEAVNLAILGILKGSENPHIITSSIEHSSVIEAAKSSGAEISIIDPENSGIIDPNKIEKELKKNTALIVLSHSNNEIGTIQPIREISKIKKNAYLLVDASQSPLYEDVSVERLGADLLVLDGIKMYGPRSSGILVIKKGVEISPIIFGGDQEQGLRPGTENHSAAAGLAEALKIAVKLREKESKRLIELRDYAIDKILDEIPGSSLNGDRKKRLPSNINICLPLKMPFKGDQDSEFLVIKLDTLGFAVSAASACNNLSLENSSYVIEAIGKKECSGSSLRITLGRETKKSDLDKLISTLRKIL